MIKRILKHIYILLPLFTAGKVFAQADSNRIEFHKSSFIDFHLGGVYNNAHNLRRTMENATFNLATNSIRYIPDIQNIRAGYSAGFTAYYGTERGVLFGGGFNYMNVGSYADNKLKFSLHNFALTLNIGKVLYNFNSVLMHAYIGLGYTEYLLRITNVDPESVVDDTHDYKFNPKKPLKYNQSAYYHSMVPIIEVGYGVRKIFKDRYSIAVIGGFYFSSSSQSFFSAGSVPFMGALLDSRESPSINGAFVRVVLELKRKGTKIYAGPRQFHIDTIAVKRQQRQLDSIENVATVAKKGTFENTYKKTLEEQYNEKGYNVRFSMGGTNAVAYNDTSAISRAAAVSLGSAAPVGTDLGQASVFVPLTPNVVRLPASRRSSSTVVTISDEDVKKIKNPNEEFDFKKDSTKLAESKLDTVKKTPILRDSIRTAIKDTAAKDTTKKLLSKDKTKGADSSKAVIAKALKAKKPMTHADSVKMKAAEDRARLISAAKRKRDKRDALLKMVKQSQIELEEKYRKGLIRNDSTNEVIKLINESKRKEEETVPTDTTSQDE